MAKERNKSKIANEDTTYNEVVYMPNEIFSDLCNCKEFKSSTQIALAYCYYYYITYLYRYAKYGESQHPITQGDIKKFLGYSPINKTIDFIMKKNGLMDNLGYTSTTTDYPISWTIETENEYATMLSFTTLKGFTEDNPLYKDFMGFSPNFKIKYPVKAFYRTEDNNREYNDGTFFDISNTHRIYFKTFKSILEKSDVLSVYLYAYLKYKADKNKGKYKVTVDQLCQQTKISNRSTVHDRIHQLEDNKFIEIIRSSYSPTVGRQPNIYIALQ